MTTEQKTQIVSEIKHLCALASQKKIAVKAGVSSATVSQMINGNWELIKDDMWRRVKVKLRIELDWQTAHTENLDYIHKHLLKAKQRSLCFGISHDAGAGKTETYKLFAKTYPNVFHIECKTFWKTKSYFQALVSSCGLDDYGTTEQLAERFIDHLSSLEEPVVIIDQADKLKDPSLDFTIDIFNELHGHCALVLSGVPALEKRIKRGVKAERTGYYEIWSRIGRKWLKLKPLKLNDVTAICEANGLTDPDKVEDIYAGCEGDLRRVKKDVQSYFLNLKPKAA